MQSLDELGAAGVRRLLGDATAVVPAFGYRPRTLPIRRLDGSRVPLLAETNARAVLVDERCRVLDPDGAPVPRLFGIGLASGFVPRGPTLEGEPSFVGQTNGLWLYQNGVGDIIRQHLLRDD